MHWVKDCPHKDEAHVQRFTKDIKDEYINQFVGEKLNTAVLDQVDALRPFVVNCG